MDIVNVEINKEVEREENEWHAWTREGRSKRDN